MEMSPTPLLRESLEEWQWNMDKLFQVASQNQFFLRQTSAGLNLWLDFLACNQAMTFCNPPSSALRLWRRALRASLGAVAPSTAPTPHKTFFINNSVCVHRYRRVKRATRPAPLLIVNSLINRHYIFDLHAKRSFIRFLLDEGFDVFSLDWGEPVEGGERTSFAHYAKTLVGSAIDIVQTTSGEKFPDLLGYSMGGALALTHAALAPGLARKLTLIGSPSDFSQASPIREWVRKENFNPDKLADFFGNIPAWLATGSFHSLKPFTYATKLTRLQLGFDDPEDLATQLAIEIWLTDGVSLPGGFYSDFIKLFYQQNALWEDALAIEGAPVRLSQIACPILNIFGSRDQIVPPESCLPLAQRLGTDQVAQRIVSSGHLALIVGNRARADVWRVISDWLSAP